MHISQTKEKNKEIGMWVFSVYRNALIKTPQGEEMKIENE